MESLKGSLAAMSELFNSRMNEFQQELQKSSPAVTSTTSLAAEFSTFKKFIVSVLSTIQSQVEFLGRELERAEMRGRRKMLLLHGVKEEKADDTLSIVSVVSEKLKVSGFSHMSISRCHRLGHPSNNKPRPLVVKFKEAPVRDKVWFNKTKLKGSGLTISEFLTKTRHTIFMRARQQFGVNKCWTRDGIIHLLAPDGSHHQVESLAEFESILRAPPAVSPPNVIAAGSSKSSDDKCPARVKRTIKK